MTTEKMRVSASSVISSAAETQATATSGAAETPIDEVYHPLSACLAA